MYRTLVRPILFLFSPETIHRILVKLIRGFFRIPGLYALVKRCYTVRDPLLNTSFLGMEFSNPVGLAAGFDKNAELFGDFSAFGFSHIEVGTVTPEGQPGNPRPRSFRLPRDTALINRMGFNNRGVGAAAVNLRRIKRPPGLILGGNIGKNTGTPNEDAAEDYEACFRGLYEAVDYFVVNVSCPNITDMHKLQDQESLEAILSRIAEIRETYEVRKPVLLKISPDLNNKQLEQTVSIVSRLGLDGIVATNTTIRRDNLATPRERVEEIGSGGLSGAPLTRRSLETIRFISEKTAGKLPLIAVGGIMSANDALQMLDAGATLIQLYTGFIYEGPGLVRRINRAILKSRRR